MPKRTTARNGSGRNANPAGLFSPTNPAVTCSGCAYPLAADAPPVSSAALSWRFSGRVIHSREGSRIAAVDEDGFKPADR